MNIIAFYLPQYHTIPENDLWWGKGFTDWLNVKNAMPLFKGHYQPHLPINDDYYDLRDANVLVNQAKLAFDYGIDGFCFYHYWFNGKMLLEKPLKEMRHQNKPNIPFCICWANENWTRRWDGKDKEILIAQDYSHYDHINHIRWLTDYFKDRRYITIEGKPLFLVYYPSAISNIKLIIKEWKQTALEEGLPGLYLCAVHSHKNTLRFEKAKEAGFDAVVDFNPNIFNMPNRDIINFTRYLFPRLVNRIIEKLFLPCNTRKVINVFNYQEYINKAMNNTKVRIGRSVDVYPCVFASWDNSPRHKKNPIVIQNESKQLFKKWLYHECISLAANDKNKKIVFINAWNEWAEGCHLEPDKKNRYRFLEAVKEIKDLINEKQM